MGNTAADIAAPHGDAIKLAIAGPILARTGPKLFRTLLPTPENFNKLIADTIIDSIGAASNNPAPTSIEALMASHITVPILLKMSIKSIPAINVPICSPISLHLTPFKAAIIESRIPLAHVLKVSAASSNLKFVKKPFIPAAIDTPKFVQSKVVPKELRNSRAVLSELAIVLPTA